MSELGRGMEWLGVFGRYTYVYHQTHDERPYPYWEIGRAEDKVSVCFTFDETTAKLICLALNILDAFMRGDRAREIEELRKAVKVSQDATGGQTRGKDIGL